MHKLKSWKQNFWRLSCLSLSLRSILVPLLTWSGHLKVTSSDINLGHAYDLSRGRPSHSCHEAVIRGRTRSRQLFFACSKPNAGWRGHLSSGNLGELLKGRCAPSLCGLFTRKPFWNCFLSPGEGLAALLWQLSIPPGLYLSADSRP